ncbi:alpha/beta fold hydrolase [Actinomycetospora callitridis]|uniref:alpha/beta fold hydrolase n=1 Tax=Actinomycetospora callitridis TaxID=913944 RepID=UPI0023661B86|nr:alpha/beta hydrolase [Actinomycetospora callitridis]MDD7920082.1 alpha/beta hydrolase [Actinomycetospora callitridis]
MTFLDRNLLVDGVRLAYRDRGEGEPVVFVHGTPSWSHEWRHVVPAVEAAGHRVVTYDLLGYGDSERPLDRDTSVAAQTDLLLGLLDELGLERPSLITHDIGGAIGQRIAVLHPQRARRLMLIDTVSYDSWPSETWREIIRTRLESYAAMSAADFEEMLTRQLRMTVAGTMGDDDLRAYLAPHRTPLGRTSFFEHQVRHYDSRYTEELTDRLGDIAMPVRIVWGARDRWQPVGYAERLAADIPGAGLVVVPDAGHFVMEDEPERVTREVLDFLAGC